MKKAAVTMIDNTLRIKAPFSTSFIADLKTEIPFAYRSWDSFTREWVVANSYAAKGKEIVEKHFNTGASPEKVRVSLADAMTATDPNPDKSKKSKDESVPTDPASLIRDVPAPLHSRSVHDVRLMPF